MSPRGWASAIATRLPRGQRRRTRRREPRVVAATDYNGLRQHAGRQSPEQLRHAVARAFPDHTAGSRPPLLVRVRRRCVNPGVVILARAFPTNTANSRPPLLVHVVRSTLKKRLLRWTNAHSRTRAGGVSPPVVPRKRTCKGVCINVCETVDRTPANSGAVTLLRPRWADASRSWLSAR